MHRNRHLVGHRLLFRPKINSRFDQKDLISRFFFAYINVGSSEADSLPLERVGLRSQDVSNWENEMSHKLRYGALIGLVVLVAVMVGVLVWPTPKDAKAALIQSAYFDWDAHGFTSDAEITGVTVSFLNGNGEPIVGGGSLTYESGWDRTSIWKGAYDPPEGSVSTRITATSNSLNFTNNPATGVTDWINGNDLTIWVL